MKRKKEEKKDFKYLHDIVTTDVTVTHVAGPCEASRDTREQGSPYRKSVSVKVVGISKGKKREC